LTEGSEKEIQEIKIAVLGIPNSQNGGMYQDVKDLKESCRGIYSELRKLNGDVKSNTVRYKVLIWAFGGFAMGISTALALIIRHLLNWAG